MSVRSRSPSAERPRSPAFLRELEAQLRAAEAQGGDSPRSYASFAAEEACAYDQERAAAEGNLRAAVAKVDKARFAVMPSAASIAEKVGVVVEQGSSRRLRDVADDLLDELHEQGNDEEGFSSIARAEEEAAVPKTEDAVERMAWPENEALMRCDPSPLIAGEDRDGSVKGDKFVVRASLEALTDAAVRAMGPETRHPVIVLRDKRDVDLVVASLARFHSDVLQLHVTGVQRPAKGASINAQLRINVKNIDQLHIANARIQNAVETMMAVEVDVDVLTRFPQTIKAAGGNVAAVKDMVLLPKYAARVAVEKAAGDKSRGYNVPRQCNIGKHSTAVTMADGCQLAHLFAYAVRGGRWYRVAHKTSLGAGRGGPPKDEPAVMSATSFPVSDIAAVVLAVLEDLDGLRAKYEDHIHALMSRNVVLRSFRAKMMEAAAAAAEHQAASIERRAANDGIERALGPRSMLLGGLRARTLDARAAYNAGRGIMSLSGLVEPGVLEMLREAPEEHDMVRALFALRGGVARVTMDMWERRGELLGRDVRDSERAQYESARGRDAGENIVPPESPGLEPVLSATASPEEYIAHLHARREWLMRAALYSAFMTERKKKFQELNRQGTRAASGDAGARRAELWRMAGEAVTKQELKKYMAKSSSVMKQVSAIDTELSLAVAKQFGKSAPSDTVLELGFDDEGEGRTSYMERSLSAPAGDRKKTLQSSMEELRLQQREQRKSRIMEQLLPAESASFTIKCGKKTRSVQLRAYSDTRRTSGLRPVNFSIRMVNLFALWNRSTTKLTESDVNAIIRDSDELLLQLAASVNLLIGTGSLQHPNNESESVECKVEGGGSFSLADALYAFVAHVEQSVAAGDIRAQQRHNMIAARVMLSAMEYGHYFMPTPATHSLQRRLRSVFRALSALLEAMAPETPEGWMTLFGKSEKKKNIGKWIGGMSEPAFMENVKEFLRTKSIAYTSTLDETSVANAAITMRDDIEAAASNEERDVDGAPGVEAVFNKHNNANAASSEKKPSIFAKVVKWLWGGTAAASASGYDAPASPAFSYEHGIS